ncbi:MAG: ferredoxin-type protein NapG [Shewanella sp.]|uniref:ferredoxin-type protein NapG n=1 Tax=Shewanella sp. SNU WT4 TaxID=2590015 RepID=UPI00112B7E2C|nr:ferredoxin-type protein NapG [Shewanella sp. SNU WT4]QDF68217.1 ferredoxin-type protein NapG [Shewanella sp. SNU WT4]
MSKAKLTPTQVNRRQFLASAAKTGCVVALAGSGITSLALSSPLAAQALRPPGAGTEADFLSACVRCGLCVEACPYDTLHLARWFDGAATGTPWFAARSVPCEMCEDIPCVKACPSKALDPTLTDITAAKMGTAVLIDEVNCLNFRGLRCDVCYRVCPLIDEAIVLIKQHNARSGHHAEFIPTVNPELCTGCGKCEHACVLSTPAIKVLPTALATGKADDHDTYQDTESTTLDMLNQGFKP